MLMPFSIILDELDYQYSVHLPDIEQPKFEWVNLLVLKESSPSKSFLHVCTLSEALDLSPQKKGLYYLCIRDRIADSKETEEALYGMVIINENIDLRELFNQIQRIFIKINNWVADMQQSLVGRKGIQDLLDLSESIIGNHIVVLDPTFKLLAFTKNIDNDDPVAIELIQNGFHSEEAIKKVQKAGIIGFYRTSDDVIINRKRNISKYITVEMTYKYKYINTFTMQVIMAFCQRDFSEGQVDLFRILTNYIKVYVDQIYDHGKTYKPYHLLINDLIEGSITNERAIKQGAQNVNIPYRSTFNLYKITFADSENIPVDRIIQEISVFLVSSKVIIHNQDIVALNIYEGANPNNLSAQNILMIEHLFNEYNAICGISNSFNILSELQTAFRQAEAAIFLGQELSSVQSPWKVSLIRNIDRTFKFEDYCIYYFLEDCLVEKTEMLEKTICFEALKRLREYDLRNNMEYMKILYYYLISESRANQAATILNMHRNNVVYHLEKIRKLIEVDLDDPEIRLKLKLGYKILELRHSKGLLGEYE